LIEDLRVARGAVAASKGYRPEDRVDEDGAGNVARKRRGASWEAVNFGSLGGCYEVGLISKERRQGKELAKEATTEQEVLVGKKLVFAIGVKFGTASNLEWRKTGFVV